MDSARLMRICLVISLLFHAAILLAIQKVFPFRWNMEALHTYKVELIRPPINDIDLDNLPNTLIEHLKSQEKSEVLESQDTISLDTKDKRYITYTGMIKEKIMYHWIYPPEARLHRLEGNIIVLFSLQRDGTMSGIRITSPSGHKILDNEVIRAITRAAPFPLFPGDIKVKRLNINARFDYRLSSQEQNNQN